MLWNDALLPSKPSLHLFIFPLCWKGRLTQFLLTTMHSIICPCSGSGPHKCFACTSNTNHRPHTYHDDVLLCSNFRNSDSMLYYMDKSNQNTHDKQQSNCPDLMSIFVHFNYDPVRHLLQTFASPPKLCPDCSSTLQEHVAFPLTFLTLYS